MNWLNPIALWGLSALAVPILIHLWSKNKTKEIAFGSIRFLKESSTLQSKRIQFSELPLLLLRLLILFLVVMLLAQWVNFQETEKEKALLLGEGINVPKTYSNEEINLLKISEFGETSNHWHLLESISKQHPEIDSLIYINEFKDTDFVGAIPKLNFHLELISAVNSRHIEEDYTSLDTVLIHFEKLPQLMEQKLDKVLKANNLYTFEKLNFVQSEKQEAQLILTNSMQKREVNQIVLTDSISSDYEVKRKQSYSILYLKEIWLNNPLNEDMFLAVVTEFIAHIVEPQYQYTSFESLHARRNENIEEIQKAQTFEEELLGLIVILILLERFISYQKKHA
ncbi:BatA domain-containing protein [Marivirga sp.]|uniref:BatA domain-containing protein n=1 Tax=Marivirga sp. TaxID=2018662 RepID=UPI003DA789C6